MIIIGAGCILPSENIRKKCISSIPYVAVGAGIVALALPIAKEIAGAFAF